MWFRNLQLYRLTESLSPDPERLQQQLAEHAFTHCGGLDTHRIGWDRPLGSQGTQLLHVTDGRLMLCLRREDRLLPPAVVREALQEKVEHIEADEARPVGRKEKARLKDEIVVDLLPRAFTRSRRLYAYIDPRANLVVIDASTPKRAEELLTLLRDTLGSLKVRPLQVRQSPSLLMTRWLEGKLPKDFALTDECELKEPVDRGAIIRGRRLEHMRDELHHHIDAGMQVSRLAVEWSERLRCVLGDDLGVRRLRFTDLVMQEAGDIEADDAAARFDADFALMSAELASFIPRLIEVFGGEDGD